MLFYQTVHQGTLELLKELMPLPAIQNYYLVGGTALSLQAGHRISIDLDLFTHIEFDANHLLESLKLNFTPHPISIGSNSLTVEINQVKVDFIRHNYPLIVPVQIIDNIRLLSMEDIAAMKLNSITTRGSKKDFYDLHELLRHFSIGQLFEFFCKKYDATLLFTVLKSLTYFDDADAEPAPVLIKKAEWDTVKQTIVSEVQKYSGI